MSEFSPRNSDRLTDDDRVAHALHEAQEAGELISDAAARVIASSLHGGQSTSLYSLASTGNLDMDGLRRELDQLWRDESLEPQVKDWVAALDAYISGRPDKGIVDRWHELWLGQQADEQERRELDGEYDNENRCTSCGAHIANPHAAGCPMDQDEQPVKPSLEEAIRQKFLGVTTSSLIRHMERADDFSTDDHEIELTRRLREQGKTWRWSESFTNPQVIVYEAGEQPDGDAHH